MTGRTLEPAARLAAGSTGLFHRNMPYGAGELGQKLLASV